MDTATVAELKARLSRYLKAAKAGQEVIVTERGVPIAKLVPLEGAERAASRRSRLAVSGLLRPGRGEVRKSLLSPPPGELSGRSVVTTLLEERRESR